MHHTLGRPNPRHSRRHDSLWRQPELSQRPLQHGPLLRHVLVVYLPTGHHNLPILPHTGRNIPALSASNLDTVSLPVQRQSVSNVCTKEWRTMPP
jgi:hypothetical protein